MTAQGGVRLSDLPPGTPVQADLSYVPLIDSAPLTAETVAQTLIRVAAAYPDTAAVMWLTETAIAAMSWDELLTAARGAASGLGDINPAHGRVVLVAGNSVNWIIAMYGCAMAGMAVVPLSPMASSDEVAQVLAELDVGVVLVDENVPGAAKRVAEAVSNTATAAVVRPISEWPEHSGAITAPHTGPDDEFLVQYTSGTTGRPRAASLTHRAVLNSARFFAEGTDPRVGEVWLNPLPVYHVGGLVSGVLSCLSVANTYVVVERFSAAVALRAVREAKPSWVGMVPTMLIDLLNEPGVSEADFSSVRTVIGGATDLDPRLIDDVETRLGIRFGVGYGQSESPCMAMTYATDPTEVRTGSLGHLLPGRDYCIADRHGEVLPLGQAGELCVRGPLNMTGYLRSGGNIDADAGDWGWRRTGDVCVLDTAGILTIKGRDRDMIIRGGTNVYPAEIERCISGHPTVSEVAVFGVPDDRLGEKVVAAVRLVEGAMADQGDLAAFVEARLSPQKRPAEWTVVGDFPRTSTGKVRKQALRQAYETAGTRPHDGDVCR